MQDSFKNQPILVVGDLMLDRYWAGSTSRISPEAPVPVVHVNNEEVRIGGAGNVALNVQSLGGLASLIAITGQDEASETLSRMLEEKNIQYAFSVDQDKPTITKLRVISQHQQLMRLDFESSFNSTPKTDLIEKVTAHLSEAKLVILSDYSKGTLSETQTLIQAARQQNIPVIIDPKGGDFSRYQGATMLTPNMREFEHVAGPIQNDEALVHQARKLIERFDLDALLITRGEHGMSLITAHGEIIHAPTEAKEVFDVTGAGDTVIAAMGLAMAAGFDPAAAMNVANTAAGIVVGKMGTSTVTFEELSQTLSKKSQQTTPPVGPTTLDAFQPILKQIRTQGDTLVMTNGCFDLLHAGHVDYLQKARALGNRLLIAINTDASVRQLKGPSRPVNSLEHRMTVLSALACVDWVIPFDEETPEELIAQILPDILVKGADYAIEDIAGHKQVLENGGHVHTIPLVPGCSTTGLLEKIGASNSEA